MTPQMPDLPPGPGLETVRGPVEIPAYAPWQYGVIVALVVITLLALGYGLYRFFTRPRREESIDPLTVYQKEIEALQLLSANDARTAQMLTQAIRRYLRTQFPQLPQGLTSAELCRQLGFEHQLDSSVIQPLKQLFSQLDHLKFAPGQIVSEQFSDLVQDANKLTAEIEQVRQNELAKRKAAQP